VAWFLNQLVTSEPCLHVQTIPKSLLGRSRRISGPRAKLRSLRSSLFSLSVYHSCGLGRQLRARSQVSPCIYTPAVKSANACRRFSYALLAGSSAGAGYTLWVSKRADCRVNLRPMATRKAQAPSRKDAVQPKKAGRPRAKHSSPDYTQMSLYIHRDVRSQAKVRLFQTGGEFSALVESLLREWLTNPHKFDTSLIEASKARSAKG
jgi:hypothetical protein